MKFDARSVFAVPLLLSLVSCGSSTSLVGRWNDPAYQGRSGQKVLVVALAESERNAKVWEDSFGKALTAVQAQPIRLTPPGGRQEQPAPADASTPQVAPPGQTNTQPAGSAPAPVMPAPVMPVIRICLIHSSSRRPNEQNDFLSG